MNSDEKQRIRRRDFLAEKVLGGAAVATFPLPALAQGIRDLTMVTDWPERLPGLFPSAVRLAQTIGAATDGRLRINVFPAGSLVRPFETLDAVEAGVADMYYSDNHYFEKKSVAFNFFASTPFGLTTDELCAWVQFGGGQELWDTLGKQFNIKSLFCGSTGCQMGGWFTKEVSAPDHFKGLRYRMAGLGAEVLRRRAPLSFSCPAARSWVPLSRCDRCLRMDRTLARHGHQSSGCCPILLLPRLP